MMKSTKQCQMCGIALTKLARVAICKSCQHKTYNKKQNTCHSCCQQFAGMPDTLYCRSCRSLASKVQAACNSCGLEFIKFYNEEQCTKCRREKRIHTRSCTCCGAIFKATNHSLQLCASCKEQRGKVQSTCVVCNTTFYAARWKYVAKTCSRKCQNTLVQQSGQSIRYDDTELLAKICNHLRATGLPLGPESLGRELGGITPKVFKARGWTMQYLIDQAGINHTWFPANMSVFEKSIYELLISIFGQQSIELQKRFSDCRGKSHALPFDFWIPSLNLLIEADGTQHYRPSGVGHKMGRATQSTDQIKNAYCLSHKINLIRIRYDRYKTNKESLKAAIVNILPSLTVTPAMHCFNCWDGSKWIPISSEAQ